MARGSRSRGTRFGASADNRRPGERPPDTEHDGDGEQDGDRHGVHQRETGEHGGARSRQRGRRARDQPPVDAVGDIADDERQREQRQELRQPDHAEQERRVARPHRRPGEIVDLPADDDDEHGARDVGGEPRGEEGAEVGNGERAHPPLGRGGQSG